MTKIAILLLAALSLVYSQTPPPAAPAETEKKASIEGVVVNETTKEPLRRAEINLYRSGKGGAVMGDDNSAYAAVTDAAGKFRIENIDPGEYTLNHRKSGFIGGRNTYGSSTRLLKLGAGEALTGLRYSLLPQAIVTGHVLDDEGEPVQGVGVSLMRFRYYGGSRHIAQAGRPVQTNDRGEYRIINVQPGKYYIQANVQGVPRMGGDLTAPATAAGAPRTTFVPTFYPSATEIAQASRIEAQAGLELAGQDIALRKEKVVKVSGKVLEPDGSPAKRAFVMFAVPDGSFSRMGAMVDDKGNFAANNIRPGQYVLFVDRMDKGDDQRRETAQATLNVGDVDVENVALQLATGLEAKGSIILEGSDRKDYDFSSFGVSLNPADSSVFGGAWAQSKADGTFTLSPILPGHFTLTVHRGQGDGYVKSIQVGGEDVYGREVDASSAVAAGIRVVVRLDSALLSGTIEIPEDRKAALHSPAVLLVPADPRLRKGAEFSVAKIDQNNGFEVKDVRPGDYVAFAFEEYDLGSLEDQEVFAAVESKGTKVTLAQGESKTLALKLLPWPQEFADRLP